MRYQYPFLTFLLILYANLNLSGQEEGPTPIAEGHEKFLGNIYGSSQLTNFTSYWNQVTPENAGKWGSVESSRDVMNWTNLDNAYKLAKDNGFPFRFHVLIWGNQQPGWIESLEPAEQLEEIEEWFAAVAERYPDIDYLEVVNEPLHDPPAGAGNGNYRGALGGPGQTGWDWIINAFKLARKHFPDTPLMINEYNIVGNASNARRYAAIVDLLKAEGLIDLIGVQSHAFSTRDASAGTIRSNLDLLAERGLPLMVTEFDIDGPTDKDQLLEYQRVFPILWEHPAMEGITLWGWKPGMWRTEQGAFLVNRDGKDRPAFTWLQDYVRRQLVSIPTTGLGEELSIYPNPVTNGSFSIRGENTFTQLKVLDMRGNKLKELNILASRGSADPSSIEVQINVAPGLYLLQLSDGKKSYFSKIMVK